jgi:hypothetical protein
MKADRPVGCGDAQPIYRITDDYHGLASRRDSRRPRLSGPGSRHEAQVAARSYFAASASGHQAISPGKGISTVIVKPTIR